MLELTTTNACLLSVFGFVCYQIYANFLQPDKSKKETVSIPPVEKQDMNLKQLAQYDGKQKPNICVACNFKIYDVTKRADIYGPGGMYERLSGRDVSRAFAMYKLEPAYIKGPDDEFDDLSDLSFSQLNTMKEWEMQYDMKYEVIGKLIR